jgi:hypothetical protein
VADELNAAWLDLRHKEEVWRSACSTFDYVRSAGEESVSVVRTIADRIKAGGSKELSTQEAATLQDLKDATAASQRAMDAEIAARETFLAANREYKKLELSWATDALSRFQARWQSARPLEACCG